MNQFIGLADADDCKAIELQGVDSRARLHITRQPDGDLTLTFISADNDQEVFCISNGALGDMALEFIGLHRQAIESHTRYFGYEHLIYCK